MFLAFGEIMLRVAPEGHLRFRQVLPGRVDMTFAGAEANVCAALAMWGQPCRYVTAMPSNAVTEALVTVLRGLGIDTQYLVCRDVGRLGVYFVETGANQRSSLVVYDRDHSAISLAAPQEYHFEEALRGVTWVHVTGITPSLSENAYLATLDLVRLAHARGVGVSCDLNFRNKLWRWKPGFSAKQLAHECMTHILPHVKVLVANEEDAGDVLGIHAAGTKVEEGRINPAAYEQVAREIIRQFPDLSRVAITLRESFSADRNHWGAMLFDAEGDRAWFAPLDAQGDYRPYEILDIVDRVGAGDAFAAGLLYAMHSADYAEPQRGLQFAVAASCLKHSIKGDFAYVTVPEIAALVSGVASGRVRR
ncbi:MAG TPA: sugar kinase [Pirellulales bacterium]|jgi:2-dehydro-3-deoxygluconokinase|nr:sugar kinase [Pirellulales bacterium]